MRTGIGIDAHRFQAGRKLFLGGVFIASDLGLAGHSDADVLVHAIMDALLGACGGGDIGEMFPDSDPAYRDADSLTLLERVRDELSARGFQVVNVDAVVVCEKPRISPHKLEMRENIARALRIDRDAVSVKGTTTEGMGFTGRGEGISAVASVLID
ncbi:MAG TPA: 2-C-methyl-D-erythritol 2,4-cyclodiphosphate synthase [Candidatus Anoxymicrobiaceae bacterium]